MERVLEGGCLCGAVRYHLRGVILARGSCHCRTCRKASSAPELPFLTLHATSFEFVQGKPVDYRSSAEVTRSFCGRCGSPLTYRHDTKPDKLDVMACSLDDPDAVSPSLHLWVSHKPAWHKIGDTLPVYDRVKTQS